MSEATVKIRAATPQDQAFLTGLITASYARLDTGLYASVQLAAALPVMSKANPRLLASGTYYVAEVDGAPAACGGWSFEKPGGTEITQGVAHIRHFATHPDFLRRGLARLLLDKCLAEAAAGGAKLMKSQATLPAEKFYASAGFVTIKPIEVEMGPGITLPALDMERALP